MRILVLFSARLLASRGTPSRSRNLTRTLIDQPGNEVLVLSGDPAGSVAEALGARHESLSYATLLEQLAAAVQSFRPQVIYGQTSKSAAPLARVATGTAVTVVDLHGDLGAEKLEQRWRPISRRIRGFARARLDELRWFGKIDAFTTVSENLAKRVRRLGVPTEVIWGGVDPELFHAPPPHRSEGVTVAYAGNFLAYQGLPTLVDAMARLDSRFRLLLVGDPTGGERLLERARRALGQRLTVLDPVPYAEIPHTLAEADVLAVPRPMSRTARFAFPSKLPEYLALGRAVVVTEVGEQARVVSHGENALIVPPGSVGALTEALASLADDALRLKLGKAGRRLAEGCLSWARIGRQLQSFLSRLVAERTGGNPPAAQPAAVNG